MKWAPGMALAICAPCHGGVAGSSAAAMTRVGAVMAEIAGRWSMAPIASAQPAYPPGLVPVSMAATAATDSGQRRA